LQELCTDGQLYDMLKKKRRISEKYTAYIIRQLLEGLRYLHMNSIFHRDIKPENILMENVRHSLT
jgi:serine/threonine protein kinase